MFRISGSVLVLYLICLSVRQGSCGVTSQDKDELHNDGTTESTGAAVLETVTWPFTRTFYGVNQIQSPIHIETDNILQGKDLDGNDLKPLRIFEPENTGVEAFVKNNGETVFVYIDGSDRKHLPYLEGGPLRNRFYFEQMHFHWGDREYQGTEHTIDRTEFSMEIHMVHFNDKYTNFNIAKTHGDGLAVLTVFVEAKDDDDTSAETLVRVLHEIQNAGSHKKIHWKEAMHWAINGVERNVIYYAYPGSLTTEPFSQNVVFILLPKPIHISHNQLAKFREINNANRHHIMKNRREVQALNGRPIIKGVVNVEEGKPSAGIALRRKMSRLFSNRGGNPK